MIRNIMVRFHEFLYLCSFTILYTVQLITRIYAYLITRYDGFYLCTTLSPFAPSLLTSDKVCSPVTFTWSFASSLHYNFITCPMVAFQFHGLFHRELSFIACSTATLQFHYLLHCYITVNSVPFITVLQLNHLLHLYITA